MMKMAEAASSSYAPSSRSRTASALVSSNGSMTAPSASSTSAAAAATGGDSSGGVGGRSTLKRSSLSSIPSSASSASAAPPAAPPSPVALHAVDVSGCEDSAAADAALSGDALSWCWACSQSVRQVGLLNSLLIFGPPAVLLRCLSVGATAQFFLACLAIIPLAGFLGEATEHLSDHLGPGTGGLLNATFGNAAELIIASFSVFRGLDTLVKSSLVGSIIGNLLLVLGASILCGGIRFSSQEFSINAANIDSNMSVVAAIGFLVPSMFHHFQAAEAGEAGEAEAGRGEAKEHRLSLGISVIFLCTYIFMLFFQLRTHAFYFDAKSRQEEEDGTGAAAPAGAADRPSEQSALLLHRLRVGGSASLSAAGSASSASLRRPHLPTSSFHIPRSFRALTRSRNNSDGSSTPRSAGTPTTPSFERLGRMLDRQASTSRLRDEYGATLVDVYEDGEEKDGRGGEEAADGRGDRGGAAVLLPGTRDAHGADDEEDGWTMRKSLLVLVSATLGIVVLSEVLTAAVERAGAALGLSHLFVGVVIVAIVGNAAEHTTAVISALHNDMDIAISIAFGSALQIAMFVMPVIVLLSYTRQGRPMDLTLSEFEVFGVTCATVISWMVVQDGASTWLEGLMLLVIYLILGLAFFFADDSSE